MFWPVNLASQNILYFGKRGSTIHYSEPSSLTYCKSLHAIHMKNIFMKKRAAACYQRGANFYKSMPQRWCTQAVAAQMHLHLAHINSILYSTSAHFCRYKSFMACPVMHVLGAKDFAGGARAGLGKNKRHIVWSCSGIWQSVYYNAYPCDPQPWQ
jgi:hypothetical protein